MVFFSLGQINLGVGQTLASGLEQGEKIAEKTQDVVGELDLNHRAVHF